MRPSYDPLDKCCCARRVVACNLILEYTLSVAVCARAFSAYGATLFGQAPDSVLLHLGPFKLDFCALLLVLLLGVLLAAGTRESAAFNTGETGVAMHEATVPWMCQNLGDATWCRLQRCIMSCTASQCCFEAMQCNGCF